ncbi:MAG: TonB-dependent receptor, partial [Bryobacteraceae bacterium]|nr:TonB-dependent receptor [Bryobacteraceae bacterium]
SRGNYIATALAVGTYSVNVTFTGFKQSSVGNVILQVDQQARVDIQLEVGDAATKVEISDTPPLLSTDTSSVGQVIDNKKIVDLPLNGRNFTQLAALTPGVLTTQVTGTSAPLTGSTTVQVGGGQYNKTEFLIDGVSSQEQGLDGVQLLPSVDAVNEFKVHSNSFAAEYGRGSAIINATIKSGTNEYHGVLFEFLRNDKMDARNFFAPTKGPYKQNQFGGTLGGPIVRNKLFFFGNYEGNRIRRGLTRNVVVPSAAFRSGDFSALPTQLRDPLTQAPIIGNRIPASRLDPVSQNLLRFVPLPNSPTGTYQFLAGRALDGDQGTGRLDYQVTEKDVLFLRYSRNVQNEVIPGNLPDSGTLFLASRAHNAALGYTRIFSPTFLNELRLGYTHLYTDGTPQGLGTNYTVQSGIRGFEQTSSSFPGFPEVTVTGFGTLVATLGFRPAIAPFDTKQFVDNVTWTRGRHTAKFGFDYRRFHYVEENGGTASRGRFNYGGAYSGNGFADYILGYPNSGQRSYPTQHFGLSDTQYHFFVQDDFKVNRKLTLNIGLRYEFNSIPKADLAQSSTFDEKLGKIVVSTLPNGQINVTTQQVAGIAYGLYSSRIVTAAEANYPNDLQEMNRNQWAPRFGFAYRPSDDNRTVIRGGYGIFYLLLRPNNFASYQIQNVPFSADELKDNTTPSPTLTTANFFDAPFGTGTPRLATLERKINAPYMQQWNIAVQRQLLGDWTIDVAYVANKGNKLEQRYTTNFVQPGPGNVQSRRPFPLFGAGTRY